MMALTSSGIQKAREILNNIMNNEDELTDLKQITSFMQNDSNFNNFIQGTQFGQETYQKWKDLVTLISDDLYQCLANIDHATSNFLNEQENNNKGVFSGKSSKFNNSDSSIFEDDFMLY
ncbi:MAG: hypothetical protein IJZ46_03575 [Bacilli bacterium]|nr:hypothetical protein [Bacilli bacterium]